MIFYLSAGMENCKMSGKSRGVLRWMISGNPVHVLVCILICLCIYHILVLLNSLGALLFTKWGGASYLERKV